MRLRVGVIGHGVMGRHHCRVLSSDLQRYEFVGVADPDPSQTSVAYTVYDSPSMLLGEGLDYCVIAAPTKFHFDLAAAAAECHTNCLIEKPIASTSKEAKDLVKIFEATNLTAGVGHIERYNPAIIALRKKLEEGFLGEIFQISTRRQGPFPARISDVGVSKDLATHDLHLTMWIADSDFKTISSQVTAKAGRPFEDMVVAIGRLQSGAITNHVVNWLSPFKERLVVVTGENGALVADTLNMNLTFHANGKRGVTWDQLEIFRGVSIGNTVQYEIDRPEPLISEHQAFAEAVIGNRNSEIISLEVGTRVLELAEIISGE
jgi:UDP-N-acetylglucosamine 3-dehydrogenase